MISKMVATGTLRMTLGLILLVGILLCLADDSEAYKKPPFNGSIFGKRGTSESDPTGRTFSALCELASEACIAWFPGQDNK